MLSWFGRSSRLAGVICTLSVVSPVFGGETYTQTPEVQSAVVQGEAAKPASKPADVGIWAEGSVPQWIWGMEADKNYTLRKEFRAKVKSGRLKATADNRCTILINGQKVLQNDTWERAAEADVSKYLKSGDNVIEAKVENDAGSPAGFIFKLVMTLEDGKS